MLLITFNYEEVNIDPNYPYLQWATGIYCGLSNIPPAGYHLEAKGRFLGGPDLSPPPYPPLLVWLNYRIYPYPTFLLFII